jgi:hypothetical protein
MVAWFHSKSEGDITCICLRWLSRLREWTIVKYRDNFTFRYHDLYTFLSTWNCMFHSPDTFVVRITPLHVTCTPVCQGFCVHVWKTADGTLPVNLQVGHYYIYAPFRTVNRMFVFPARYGTIQQNWQLLGTNCSVLRLGFMVPQTIVMT